MSRERPSWLGRSAEWPEGSPRPGQVFWVHTDILGRRDAHPDAYRPAVVISVSTEVGRVFVVMRTTDPNAQGVRHARVPEVGLDKDGMFDPAWYQSVELSLFKPPLADYIFDLATEDPDKWADVNVTLDET